MLVFQVFNLRVTDQQTNRQTENQNAIFFSNQIVNTDYSHYMAAVMKYYIAPCMPKEMKQERCLMINSFKALFWAQNPLERDEILFSMLILAYSHPDGNLFRYLFCDLILISINHPEQSI